MQGILLGRGLAEIFRRLRVARPPHRHLPVEGARREAEKRRRGIETRHGLGRHRRRDRGHAVALGQRLALFPRRRQRDPARVVPHAGRVSQVRRRRRLAQDLVPLLEPRERVVGDRKPELHGRHLPDRLGGDVIGEGARHPDRFHAPPLERHRRPGHVHVVDVVHHRVDAMRLLRLDVGVVDPDRLPVQLGRVAIAAHAHVDVGGHVDQMPGVGGQLREPPRGEESLSWMGRFLEGVDVEVIGPGVGWVLLQDPGQGGDGFLDSRLGLAVRGPPVPGPHVQERLGVDRGCVEIVGIFRGEIPHRVREGLVEGLEIRLGIAGIALRERFDPGAFARGRPGRPRAGFPHFRERFLFARRIHREVHVGPEGEGDAPVCHGAGGIETRRLAEGADGLVVIEGVAEPEALVEILLRERGSRGHRVVHGPEAGVERDGPGCEARSKEKHEERAEEHRTPMHHRHLPRAGRSSGPSRAAPGRPCVFRSDPVR